MESGRVARVSLTGASQVKTTGDLGIGSTAARVRAALPNAVVEPHKYVQGAETLTGWTGARPTAFVEDPTARGIRYETDATGRVTTIHAGGPAIQLVESCG